MTRALVCGAGVGGLSVAAALKRKGFAVRVFEKHSELRTAGVGLNMWPNGVSALREIGFAEQYPKVSTRIDWCRSYDQSGEMTSNVDVRDWPTRFGAPLTGAHRRKLNEMLAGALSQEELRFDREVIDYEQDGASVRVHFRDGSIEEGELLIGADGIGSRVRNVMLGGEPAFSSDGIVRWRGVFTCAAADVDEHVQCDVFGEKGHFGWIPIGAGEAYWFSSFEGAVTFDDVLEHLHGWGFDPVLRVLAATQTDTIIHHRLADLASHLVSWVDGRVALLGDAAHPVFPGMAQGANQALEDAVVLADAIATSQMVTEGLRNYERKRMPLARRVVEGSRAVFDFEDSQSDYSAEQDNLVVRRYLQMEEFRRSLDPVG